MMIQLTPFKLLAISSLLLLSGSAASGKFYSQLQPCPQTCATSGPSPSNWTTYHSFDRLERCNQTVLFDFNIFNSVEGPNTHTTIRACTADDTVSAGHRRQISSTCGSTNSTSVIVQLASWESSTSVTADSASVSQAVEALEALQSQLASASDCGDPTILFAYAEDVVVGLYVGGSINSVAATTALVSQVTGKAQTADLGDGFAAQVCGTGFDGSQTMGLMVRTTTNYASVQSAVQSWANATCVTNYDSITTSNITVSPFPTTVFTADHTVTQNAPLESRDDTCSYVLVVSGTPVAAWLLSVASQPLISPHTIRALLFALRWRWDSQFAAQRATCLICHHSQIAMVHALAILSRAVIIAISLSKSTISHWMRSSRTMPKPGDGWAVTICSWVL